MLSITPFGQSGPYADHASDDLTLLALSGFLNMMGYPDGPPTQAHGEQAYAMGCMFGAVGAMMAVLHAQATGEGQHVDVAIQEAAAMAMENAAQFYELEGKVRRRFAGEQRHPGTGLFECSDGYIYLFAGGMAAARFWSNLVNWVNDEGVPGAAGLRGPEWSDLRYLDTEDSKQVFAEIVAPFMRARSKEVLYREGQARRVPLCPVSSPADILASRQLRARHFFTTATHRPSGRRFEVPGAPYRLSATPWRQDRPAPLLGQHTREILGA
jgi:benzylsuccinate CoA-transferase BbsE subunit